jgi:hypothetical protein
MYLHVMDINFHFWILEHFWPCGTFRFLFLYLNMLVFIHIMQYQTEPVSFFLFECYPCKGQKCSKIQKWKLISITCKYMTSHPPVYIVHKQFNKSGEVKPVQNNLKSNQIKLKLKWSSSTFYSKLNQFLAKIW